MKSKIVEDTNFGMGFQKKKVSSLLAMVTIGHCPVLATFTVKSTRNENIFSDLKNIDSKREHPRVF